MPTNIETAKCHILMIMPDRNNQMASLRNILTDRGFDVCQAACTKTAIQKVKESSPLLVVCNHEVDGITGFRVFKTLQPKLLKRGLPFFLFFDKYRKEDLLMGLEMGINNFIIYPFDELSVLNKIEKLILKRKKSFIIGSDQFKYVFEITPIAKFISEDEKIIRVNRAFAQLTGLNEMADNLPGIPELFSLDKNETAKYDLEKCMNGLKNYCLMKSIPLRSNPSLKFYIHLVNNDYLGDNIFIGEVIPGQNVSPEQTVEKLDAKKINLSDVDVLTKREREILELSAKGLPIKQIAYEMHISARTVEKHRSNIMLKTNTTNIIEAIYLLQK
jgi:DNA-binding NarL/FixJ family response regulator